MALPYLVDTRRATGRTILMDAPGAVMEAAPPAEIATHLATRWRREVRRLTAALGWEESVCNTLWFGPSLHLGLTAPVDQLMLATYVAEWAYELALSGVIEHEVPRRSRIVARLTRRKEGMANPLLDALYRRAIKEKAQILLGEGDVSVGEGVMAQTWRQVDPPEADGIDWPTKRHRVPIALVTGTNGKTTTTRLLARMAELGGRETGFCCTDSVEVSGDVLDRDDYSGPGGTRKVLRHPRTEFAVLEVARGGMLRRGLGVRFADAAIVTNIADDHMHDMGIHTRAQLARVKFLVAHALKARGVLITNLDNGWCRDEAKKVPRPVLWFALTPPPKSLLRGPSEVRGLATVRDGMIVLEDARLRIELLPVEQLGMPGGGAASHNVANALAAAAAAYAMKLPLNAIRGALKSFGQSPDDNPGRSNVFRILGATVLADFGHNPQSLTAIFGTAKGLPHRRLLISIGQGGDRSDDAIRELGLLAAQQHPELLVVKDMPKYRRGRAVGEIPDLLFQGATAGGLAPERVMRVEGDLDAWECIKARLHPGDLAIVFVHSEIEEVFAQLRGLATA